MKKKPTYHGWIVVERGGGHLRDSFHCEYYNKDGQKVRFSDPFYNPADAIEWFEKRLGKTIRLLSTPLGAYRVYTEEEAA